MSELPKQAEAICSTEQTPAAQPELRMRAYYFAFSSTGNRLIDEILSAVATAGKAYHHTEEWYEAGYVDKIQGAATKAALEIQRLQAALDGAHL